MMDRERLFSRGYVSLLVTQFLGAANDNILKQVLIFMVTTGVWADRLGDGGQSYVTLCLTIPFIFLSGFAGQIADRFSKRSVLVGVKVAEVPIACLALFGLYVHNLWFTMGSLLLLAIQSSFFGPAKYGSVPELCGDGQLSRANGVLTMATNLAVIVGVVVAGKLSDLYAPGQPGVAPVPWAPGVALVAVAVMGLAAVLLMPHRPAADPTLKIRFHPFQAYWDSLREMGTPLLAVMLAWSGFYMIGTMALLIIPEYKGILDISFTDASLLCGTLGITVAISSVAAGLVSGHTIKPQLIPLGAMGMSVTFILLGTLTPSWRSVLVLIAAAGLSAGFYVVPILALLQKLSPPGERGRFLGTANGMSFVACSLGAALYWLQTDLMGLPANRVHLACALLAIAGTVAGTLQLRRLMAMQRAEAPGVA